LRESHRERGSAELGLAAISGSLDPVFILGQGFGVFAYLRNLYFIKRERRAGPAAAWKTAKPQCEAWQLSVQTIF